MPRILATEDETQEVVVAVVVEVVVEVVPKPWGGGVLWVGLIVGLTELPSYRVMKNGRLPVHFYRPPPPTLFDPSTK